MRRAATNNEAAGSGGQKLTRLTHAALSEFNRQTTQTSQPDQPMSGAGLNVWHPFITDEEEQLMVIENRIHHAIRRNILRDTMSEDLDWALCIKNDDEELFDRLRLNNQNTVAETRSLNSTPERGRGVKSTD